MASILIGTCRQENCKVAIDGKCLEGFSDLKQCPHFSPAGHQEDTPEAAPEVSVSKQVTVAEMIALPNGEALNSDAAREITQSALTRLIILAGAPGSGKTTLLTSIYESFQERPFAGYMFAGSRTLPGFERRCHLGRMVSERMTADTELSRLLPGQYPQLLHLRVRAEDLVRPAQDLLLSDLPGETFRLVKDSTEECRKLSILGRTDHFVLFLDGDKISKTESRAEVMTDGASLLRSCLDAELLGKHSLVDVLFTKWDKVQSSPDKDKTEEYIDRGEKQMKDRFEARVGRLRFFRVAARPDENSTLPFAHGLSQVFPSWIEESALFSTPSQNEREPQWPSEFDRYLITRFPQRFTRERS